MIDLDGFKPVNDTYGHAVGDALLVQIAQRLSAALRISDVIARVGGDEFIGLFPDVGNRDSLSFLGERLLGVFDEPFEVMGHRLSLSGSIGLVVAPADGEDQGQPPEGRRRSDVPGQTGRQAARPALRRSAPVGLPEAASGSARTARRRLRRRNRVRSGKMPGFPAAARPCPSNLPRRSCQPLPSSVQAARPVLAPGPCCSALVRWCLAAAGEASGVNGELFRALNAAAAGLPSDVGHARRVRIGAGAIALLAPTLKTRPRWLASAFLAAPLAILFSEGSKRYFDVLRPAGVLGRRKLQPDRPALNVARLPVGPATTAFVAAAVLVLAWRGLSGAAGPGCWYSARPGWSPFARIAVGAHWPLDVLTGAAGGWLCGAWGSGCRPGCVLGGPGGVRAMATVALAASLALLFVDAGQPDVRLFRASACRLGHRRCRRGPHAGARRISSHDQNASSPSRYPPASSPGCSPTGAGAASARCSCASTASPLGLAVAGFLLSYLLRPARLRRVPRPAGGPFRHLSAHRAGA